MQHFLFVATYAVARASLTWNRCVMQTHFLRKSWSSLRNCFRPYSRCFSFAAPQLQYHRQEPLRFFLAPAMRAFVEIIGSGNEDSSSSIQLFFDEGRYLFECGDGTQRLCTEYSIKLARLRGIYLTSLSAPSVGGLLGLILTVADSGKEALSLSAPHGLKNLLGAARPFFYRPSLKWQLKEVDLQTKIEQLPVFITKDENVTIQAVPVRGRGDVEIDTSFGAHYDAITYICRMSDIRGKFNPERAIQLGVKRGRNFGLLQRGESVTAEDGTEVKSEQVMSQGTPGPVLLIVSCPSIDHIQSLVTAPSLNPSQLHAPSSNSFAGTARRQFVLCHLAPKEVLETISYQRWCDSFGEDASHIMLHSSTTSKRVVFASQAENIELLHSTVDKNLFPLPFDSFEQISPTLISEESAKVSHPIFQTNEKAKNMRDICSSMLGKWVNGDCRLKYILSPAPTMGLDKSGISARFLPAVSTKTKRPWREALPIYAIEPLPEEEKVAAPEYLSSLPAGTAVVRFFGTGAAIPGKHRNVSSIMLDMFERGGVLFDCGEGSWGQMVRHFGLERARTAIGKMKVIFISHMHADHHLGLLRLLHERTIALKKDESLQDGPQLVIVGPWCLAPWLGSFQACTKVPPRDRLSPGKASFKFCDAKSLTDPQAPEGKFFGDAFGIDIGCVEVKHCPYSFGVIIEDCVNGWKIVYSGDTRPCDALAEAGKNATLAIHEATFEDEMAEEAREKMHSTTSEALDICGNKMGAWRTILTHFSQRYPKIPKLDDKTMRKLYECRAAVAFDLMCVDLTQLEDLPKIMPAVRDCFPDEVVDESMVEPQQMIETGGMLKQ